MEHMGFKRVFKREEERKAQGIRGVGMLTRARRHTRPLPYQSYNKKQQTQADGANGNKVCLCPRLFLPPHTLQRCWDTPGPVENEKESNLLGRHRWILCYSRNSPRRRKHPLYWSPIWYCQALLFIWQSYMESHLCARCGWMYVLGCSQQNEGPRLLELPDVGRGTR